MPPPGSPQATHRPRPRSIRARAPLQPAAPRRRHERRAHRPRLREVVHGAGRRDHTRLRRHLHPMAADGAGHEVASGHVCREPPPWGDPCEGRKTKRGAQGVAQKSGQNSCCVTPTCLGQQESGRGCTIRCGAQARGKTNKRRDTQSGATRCGGRTALQAPREESQDTGANARRQRRGGATNPATCAASGGERGCDDPWRPTYAWPCELSVSW